MVYCWACSTARALGACEATVRRCPNENCHEGSAPTETLARAPRRYAIHNAPRYWGATSCGAWRTGTVQEFLGLTDEEAAYVELRHQLARALQELRIRLKLTQIDAAKRLQSSQSRVAKMEAAGATVSLDLLLRALLALGASPEMLARAMRRCA